MILDFDMPASGAERVLWMLKTKGPQTAAKIATGLGVTTMAVRQHLAALEEKELVSFTDEPHKVGRPARAWKLTERAYNRFPNQHAELAVRMLQAVEGAFGEGGVKRLAEEQTRQQIEQYRTRMPGMDVPLDARVAALVRIRREEGYMPELHQRNDGTLTLVENHCAIAAAAHHCSQLCGSELSLFRAVLGKDISIERTEHILSGDRCCTYLISPAPHQPA
jgi:predicted ArsR family transcriptional regulator